MKKYKVKVNGKVYEVELEAVEETAGSIQAPVAAAPAAAPAASTSGGAKIVAPIGGKVLDIKVKAGDAVKKGDTVAVIEAMKLENEIKSEFDGTVKEVVATKGSMVQSKDALIILA